MVLARRMVKVKARYMMGKIRVRTIIDLTFPARWSSEPSRLIKIPFISRVKIMKIKRSTDIDSVYPRISAIFMFFRKRSEGNVFSENIGLKIPAKNLAISGDKNFAARFNNTSSA